MRTGRRIKRGWGDKIPVMGRGMVPAIYGGEEGDGEGRGKGRERGRNEIVKSMVERCVTPHI